MKVLDTNRHEKAGQTGQVFSLFRPSRLPVIRHAPRVRLRPVRLSTANQLVNYCGYYWQTGQTGRAKQTEYMSRLSRLTRLSRHVLGRPDTTDRNVNDGFLVLEALSTDFH